MAHRPSPFENPNGRQSPFRRQNSASPATARAAAPTPSPTKATSTLSPTKPNSLSPEKTSPFVRRPSQISHAAERPTSPFARPSSSLSIPASPSRNANNPSQDEPLRSSLRLSPTPASAKLKPSKEVASYQPKEPDTPVVALSTSPHLDGASSPFEEKLSGDSPFSIPPSPAVPRPTVQRTATSSTAATIMPPVFGAKLRQATAAPPKIKNLGGGAYNYIPHSLLHSMRESFAVLDSNNEGAVNSAAVSDMLAQLGLDATPASLKDFFPPNGATQLNLARYLDTLSSPLADLSEPDELRAAFEAFDVDDSGQVDVSMLRDALLHTVPQLGEDAIHLSQREVDGILGEFTGRRAFGTKGMHAPKGKGDVFRYRDFMASVSGGGANSNGPETTLVA